MTTRGQSRVVRLALALGMLVLASAAYRVMTPDKRTYPRTATSSAITPDGVRPQDVPPPGPNSDEERAWYLRRVPEWRSFAYVRLSDRAVVDSTIQAAVRARRSGPELDESRLAAALGDFLFALGAPDPDEYLRRLGPGYVLREDVFDDIQVQTLHRILLGGPLPADVDARTLMGTFWNADRSAVGRPQSLARTLVIQAARSRPLSGRERNEGEVFAASIPQFSLYRDPDVSTWVDGFSQGLVRLTRGSTPLGAVLRDHSTTLMAVAQAAVTTTDDRILTIGVILYFSPSDGRWFVFSVGSQYPGYVSWPI